MRKKIVLIGAGSAMFTQGVIIDLIEDYMVNNRKWHLALVDIDGQILESVRKLCIKMAGEKEADIEVSTSVDRCDVLPGADYVVSTIGVGGRRAWEQDVLIPRKYGVYQSIGDTTMPGGISRAMRMIPAMVDIANDVKKMCPHAWFFNYSNPMSIVCRAVRKATAVPVIGLCHGVFMQEWHIAGLAGLDKNKVTSLYAGINHLTFIYDFRFEGNDVWPVIREKLEDFKRKGYDFHNTERLISKIGEESSAISGGIDPFSCSLFEDYGAFPAPGDAHVCEFYYERFPNGKYYGKTLGIDIFPFERIIEGGNYIHDEIVQLAEMDGKLPEKAYKHILREKLIDIINSIEKDKRGIFPVNVPNNGAVSNLPQDGVIEIPAVATSKGLLPVMQDGFPDILAGITSKHLAEIEVIVEAALRGDRKLFTEAVMMEGYMTDRSAADRMVEELIVVHGRYLPQF